MHKIKLGDVAKEFKDTYKESKLGMPVVGLEHLVPQEMKLTAWDGEKDNTFTKMFRKGHILFGRRRAYLKKAAVAPFDGICSGDITVIEAIPSEIVPELLPFIIQNDKFFDFAIGKSAGSLSPRVKWEHLKEYEFMLPSIEAQKKLSEVLWAFQDAKETYKKLLTATDELVKSQFIEMFENEKINIKWDSVKLSELFELQMGKTPSRSNSYYWDSEDFRWISIADLSNYSKYTADTKEKISKLAVEKTGIKQIPKDTLIMSFKLTIGKTAITSEPIYTNEAIMAFIDKRSADFSIEYLNTMLSYMNWDKVSKQAVKGATLNKATIGSVKITVPPIELQNQFAVFIEQIDKSKFALLQNIEKLEQCRNAVCVNTSAQIPSVPEGST